MAPALNRIGMPRWITSPFPPMIFQLLNSLTPLALPAAAAIVMSYTYMQQYMDMMSAWSQPNFSNPFHVDVFDFIIVGGGSAGSVLANRLSKHNRVLLLEAGGNPHPVSLLPLSVGLLMHAPMVDWQYYTEPQKFAAFGFVKNRTVWPRGKSLGGSSVTNAMIYMRGNERDYEQWAKATGDDSWRYKNLLPFFKKLETYQGNYKNESIHGSDGPITVQPLSFVPGNKQWLQAAREMGYKIRDLNAYQKQGFMITESTTQNGVRSDTYRAYLRDLKRRKNLVISRFSYVIKVHLDLQRNAYGVTYVRHGVQKFVRANKEIILSAGAINTPHLLLLSGIGPKRHLHSKGLRCRVNLPVGKNLQDHVMTILGPVIVNESVSFIADRNISVYTGLEYLVNREGVLAMIPAASTSVVSSSFADPSWPDIFTHQMCFAPHKGSQPMIKLADEVLGFRPGVLSNHYAVNEGKDSYFVSVSLGRPFSRGEVYLRNRDPFEKPLMDPKYFSDRRDVDILIEGIKKHLRLFEEAPTFKKLGAYLPTNPFPGCEDYIFKSDDYWECYVRTLTLTIYHPCCTCKMGKRINDTRAVVDSEFRVLKTRNLRVIDASIMPTITNANLNIPSIMIGEKGSDVVRNHWMKQFLICNQIEYLINPLEQDLKCFYTKLV